MLSTFKSTPIFANIQLRNAFTGTRYAKSHEYIKAEGNGIAKFGISDYAQKALGDLVYIEAPTVGASKKKGETTCVVESVKSVSDVYAPANMEVIETNPALASDPTLLNKDPEGKGWIAKVKLANLDDFETLLDASAYKKHCETEHAHH